MVQIIGLLLCVYLVFKGVEIFQTGLASTREDRKLVMTVGLISLVSAIGIAGFFALLFIVQGASIGDLRP